MAFSYEDKAEAIAASGTTITLTPAAAPASGELIVVYLHADQTGGFTPSQTWEASSYSDAVASETCTQAIYWKIAGASEPSSYTFTQSTAEYRAMMYVFSSASDASLNNTIATHRQTVKADVFDCGAADGDALPDNCLSLIFGGHDRRSSSGHETVTQADNSYDTTNILGGTEYQRTGGTYRIYTTGHTSPFSGDITLNVTDGSMGTTDNTYSLHAVFTEGGGGGGLSIPVAMHHYMNNTGR